MSSSTPLDPSTPITLISSQGDEFVVEYDLLRASGVLKRLFASSEAADFEEQRSKVVKLRDISTAILRKIIDYCEYKHAHEHSSKAPPPFHIDEEDAIELLMAANFLDI
jgi:transcription elongation factor B subunit 1